MQKFIISSQSALAIPTKPSIVAIAQNLLCTKMLDTPKNGVVKADGWSWEIYVLKINFFHKNFVIWLKCQFSKKN